MFVLRHRARRSGPWWHLGVYQTDRDAGRAMFAFMWVSSGDWHAMPTDDKRAKVEAFKAALSKRAAPVDAAALIERLAAENVTVFWDDEIDKLRATGAVTDAHREMIRRNKDAIVEYLRAEPSVTTWSQATAAQLIDGTKAEVADLFRRMGTGAKGLVYDGAFSVMATALEWMAASVRDRDMAGVREQAGYLGWLCKEVTGWLDGSIALPPDMEAL